MMEEILTNELAQDTLQTFISSIGQNTVSVVMDKVKTTLESNDKEEVI